MFGTSAAAVNYIRDLSENNVMIVIFVMYFAGLDARGFLFGPIVSLNLNVPFVPIRKSGKLPGPTVKASSTKEYGKVRI